MRPTFNGTASAPRRRAERSAVLPLLTSLALGLALFGCRGDGSSADPGRQVVVAVAANFLEAHEGVSERFTARTGIEVVTSAGSTGQLFAQIRNGAPFDVFLAADSIRPRRLEEEGLVAPGSRLTYARGRLVLYGPSLPSVQDGGADLRSDAARRVAIANPRTAPYGAAAMEVLARLGVPGVEDRLVQGESVGQTYQFVESGAAELGFVALSQVADQAPDTFWLVPDGLYSPILQQAVLLRGSENGEGARAFIEFLTGEEARTIMESFGYSMDGSTVPDARSPADPEPGDDFRTSGPDRP